MRMEERKKQKGEHAELPLENVKHDDAKKSQKQHESINMERGRLNTRYSLL